MKKLLQLLGVLALLAWTVVGAAAWFATKGQVHLLVSADDPTQGPDPVALLQDDVASLHGDLEGLTEMLGRNFSILDERVSNAVSGADRPAAEPARTDAVERELRMRIAELEARLDVMERALRDGAPEPAAGAVEPVSAQAAPEVAVATPDEPEPEIAEPEPKPAPAPSASFLAFELPSQSFELDRRRRWTIQGSLSRVGFDGKSSLHDFTGTTSKVSGELIANPARPTERPSGTIVVDATSLDTGLDDRDEAMHEHLESGRFKTFEFELESFRSTGASDDGTATGEVSGTMTIHGTSRPFAMPIELRVDKSHRLVVQGSAPLSLPDYGVPVPNKLGLVKMEDDVQVWITLRARAGSEVE